MEDRKLYETAQGMLDNAYAPYSGFSVGAALLTADGIVFTGVNIENGAYGEVICAERTAAATAVAAGYREFKAIAVASSKGEAWPCGICRQFLYEFSPAMRVITGADADHLESAVLSDLLPHGFRLEIDGQTAGGPEAEKEGAR